MVSDFLEMATSDIPLQIRQILYLLASYNYLINLGLRDLISIFTSQILSLSYRKSFLIICRTVNVKDKE